MSKAPTPQGIGTLPELDRECDECGGNGIVTTPEWLEWNERAATAEREWRAASPGRSWYASDEHTTIEDEQPDPEMPCPACDGKGRQLTEAGRRLLAFLRTHGRG
jgi:hypothetical protein